MMATIGSYNKQLLYIKHGMLEQVFKFYVFPDHLYTSNDIERRKKLFESERISGMKIGFIKIPKMRKCSPEFKAFDPVMNTASTMSFNPKRVFPCTVNVAHMGKDNIDKRMISHHIFHPPDPGLMKIPFGGLDYDGDTVSMGGRRMVVARLGDVIF